MNNTSLLQIRVSQEIRQLAEDVALKSGFSSLQEALRLFLISYSKGFLEPTFFSNEVASNNASFYNESLDSILKDSLKEIKKGDLVKSRVVKKKLGLV